MHECTCMCYIFQERGVVLKYKRVNCCSLSAWCAGQEFVSGARRRNSDTDRSSRPQCSQCSTNSVYSCLGRGPQQRPVITHARSTLSHVLYINWFVTELSVKCVDTWVGLGWVVSTLAVFATYRKEVNFVVS